MPRHSVLASVASSWTSESPEARRLADALRGCRLSILCGERDDQRAALIVAGLLPLLRRRASDAAMLAPRDASSVVLPFPERRSRARARLAELVVFIDAWDDASPAGVHRAIDDALRLAGVVPDVDTADLAQRVRALADRHGTRVLFVFDRFDRLLDQCSRRTAPNLLLDELGSLLRQPLPAHLLISLRTQALPLLERACERWPAIDAELLTMQVSAESEPAPPNVHQLRVVAANDTADIATPQEEDRPGARDDTYADITTFVERSREQGGTAAAMRADIDRSPDRSTDVEEASDDTTPKAPSAQAVALANELTSMMLPRARPHVPVSVPALRPALLLREAQRPWALAAAAVLVLVVLFIGLYGGQHAAGLGNEMAAVLGPTPVIAARPADSAPPATPSAGPPPLEIAVESEDRTLPPLVTEFVGAVSNTAAKAIPVTTLSPATSPAPVSIVRYDALQDTALRGGSTPMRVIAPLYTEELYVIVRADSPLRYIHQLQGHRINIGPAKGARALTALALYERMFGKPLPAAKRDSLDAATALQRLATRSSFDAIVLPQPEPSSLWNSLAPETRGALRLLSLDPRHPASQRALQEYLPATLHERTSPSAAPSAIPTLAAMAFLVANGTPNAAQHHALVSLTGSFCRALPALKRDGHPKWREVRAGQQLETPWMPDNDAASAWSSCADADPALPSSPPQGARR